MAGVVFHSSGIPSKEGVPKLSFTVLSISFVSSSYIHSFLVFSDLVVSSFRKMRIYKHFDRDFKTKHKAFTFCLDEFGSKIIITERNRANKFVVEVDIRGGDWLCRVVGDALKLGRVGGFRRMYRGSNYQLFVDCGNNMAGWFLKVMKIYNGTINNIIVPAEQEFSGWLNFEKCLKSFFIRTMSNNRVSMFRNSINQKIHPEK